MNLAQLFTFVELSIGCGIAYWRTRSIVRTLVGGLIGAVFGVSLLVLSVRSGLAGG